MVIEWQSGLAENVNQYDIKAFDKFMEDGRLCLETLHFFQLQKKTETLHWMSFAIASFVKVYTVTSIFMTADGGTGPVFQIPMVVLITMYSILLPTLLDFAYLKAMSTFCQLEVIRAVADVVFPCLVVVFSLV